MRNTGKFVDVLVLSAMASCVASGRGVAQPEITTVRGLAVTVTIAKLAITDRGVVTGTLSNHTGRTVREVKVLIRYAWLWNNERAPQRDNPGRSAYYVIPGEIAPHGTLPFVYRPEPPLPRRSDGRFEPSVQVVGFAEVGD